MAGEPMMDSRGDDLFGAVAATMRRIASFEHYAIDLDMDTSELSAARAALRRFADAIPASTYMAPPPTLTTFGALRLDSAEQRVSFRGEPVPMTNKEFRTLLFLAQNHGRLVTKQELLACVWNIRDESIRTRTVDSHVSRVRRALVGMGVDIVNTWGVGYTLRRVKPTLAAARDRAA